MRISGLPGLVTRGPWCDDRLGDRRFPALRCTACGNSRVDEMRVNKGQSILHGYLPVITAIVVCVAVLLYNMFCFSALASAASVGDALRLAFNRDAPVVATYVLAGDVLRKIPGLQTLGDDTASAVAKPLQEKILGYRPAAGAVFFGEPQSPQHKRMLWTHRMQPWLLLLVAFLWWRRPRPVHLRERLRA